MASMATMDRVKEAQAVNASVETHGDEVAARIVAALAPLLRAGETMPDVAFFFELVGRQVAMVAGELSAADDAHDAELADDPPWRAKRDASATMVRGAMVDLRDAVTTAHGPDAARLLALADPPSFEPTVLAEEAPRVLGKLRDETLALPPAKRRGVKVDFGELAEDIDAGLGGLAEALAVLRREGRESERTLTAKHRALTAFDAAVGPGTALIVAAFKLGGRADLAERVVRTEAKRSSPTPGEPPAGPAGPPVSE